VLVKHSQMNRPRRTNFRKRNTYDFLEEEYYGIWPKGRAILLLAIDIQYLLSIHIYIFINYDLH